MTFFLFFDKFDKRTRGCVSEDEAVWEGIKKSERERKEERKEVIVSWLTLYSVIIIINN